MVYHDISSSDIDAVIMVQQGSGVLLSSPFNDCLAGLLTESRRPAPALQVNFRAYMTSNGSVRVGRLWCPSRR